MELLRSNLNCEPRFGSCGTPRIARKAPGGSGRWSCAWRSARRPRPAGRCSSRCRRATSTPCTAWTREATAEPPRTVLRAGQIGGLRTRLSQQRKPNRAVFVHNSMRSMCSCIPNFQSSNLVFIKNDERWYNVICPYSQACGSGANLGGGGGGILARGRSLTLSVPLVTSQHHRKA